MECGEFSTLPQISTDFSTAPHPILSFTNMADIVCYRNYLGDPTWGVPPSQLPGRRYIFDHTHPYTWGRPWFYLHHRSPHNIFQAQITWSELLKIKFPLTTIFIIAPSEKPVLASLKGLQFQPYPITPPVGGQILYRTLGTISCKLV